MSEFILKTGGNSVILGEHHYKGYFNVKLNQLIKVTRRNEKHNEFKFLSNIRDIDNYQKYYSIPDEICCILKPTDNFYQDIKMLTDKHRMTIFHGDLECCYINYAGDKDVQETLSEMMDGSINHMWRNYSDILNLAKMIMEALIFLHDSKICHLDIKPENIVMDTNKRTFKLIDFGFCSLEPFDDYINYPRGTPGYFPKNFKFDVSTEWLPFTEANDMKMIDGEVPMMKDPKLVYKIDSFCLGRVLFFTRYVYEEYGIPHCIPWWRKNSREKVDKIINLLLENDIFKRKTIKECYELVSN
jgi:hypothetical protein